MKTLAGSMMTLSVSVDLYETCLVDSVGCVLLVSSTLLASKILPPPSQQEHCLVFDCESLHWLLSAAKGSIPNSEWARHRSMSVVEYR